MVSASAEMSNEAETIREASYRIRVASLADEPALHFLIARSIRTLGSDDYSAAQIEAALTGAFGVDTSLIRDATYFVVLDAEQNIVGCGGWSRRRTLFGSDARAERDESQLDPATDAAKIRAFFVDPMHARRGIGRLLLQRCEQEAAEAGFRRCELMATLPGRRLYARYGYEGGASIEHPLPGGLTITFVPMRKVIA
jgi:GNAT superfamily N-acetyltransferase